MRKILILVLAFTLVSEAIAGAGRSGYVDISDTRIQLIQGGMSRLYVYDVNMTDSDCDVKTTPVILFTSGDLGQELYSMVLTAKASGKNLEFIAGSCVDISGNTYPAVSSIYMK